MAMKPDIEIAQEAKVQHIEEIAKKESLDKASAANGGDIGYFSRGQLVPEFERAAAALKVGEVSAPVKTSYGYHIIKVTDKKAGPVLEFDRVKDIIAQRLSGEKQKAAFDSYIEGLRKNYKVEINKDALAQVVPGTGNAEPQQATPAKPSDAKSTGRNLTCASRKNPSRSTGTFSFVASSCAPSEGTVGLLSTTLSGVSVISRPSIGSHISIDNLELSIFN